MKTLVFDTETTGFANFSAPREITAMQPYIVQLAAILYDDRKPVAQMSVIIQPVVEFGVVVDIPEKVSAIHGITNEIAAAVGIPIIPAIQMFGHLACASDRIVAHNITFDRIMVEVEYRRWLEARGKDQRTPSWADKPHLCTMRTATPICQLQSARGGYKWPKLIEAHQHFLGEGFDGAHDALADVQACARVPWAIEDAGHDLVEMAA